MLRNAADANNEGGGFRFPAVGPHVLPGKYTVRLTAGGKTLTQELEVRADPTVHSNESELRTQLEYNLKLRDMQSSVNDALRSHRHVEEPNSNTAETTVHALDPQAAKVLAGLARRAQAAGFLDGAEAGAPADIPGYSMAPRLVDRLGQLLNGIDRVLAAPTPYQMEYFNELKAEFMKDMGEVNGFVEKQIPEINDLLKKNNAGAVMAGKTIEIPSSMR